MASRRSRDISWAGRGKRQESKHACQLHRTCRWNQHRVVIKCPLVWSQESLLLSSDKVMKWLGHMVFSSLNSRGNGAYMGSNSPKETTNLKLRVPGALKK